MVLAKAYQKKPYNLFLKRGTFLTKMQTKTKLNGDKKNKNCKNQKIRKIEI